MRVSFTLDRDSSLTEDYARALISMDNPDESDDEIDRRVQLRLARQPILRRPIDPPLLKVALRESVLRCSVGDAAAGPVSRGTGS